MFPELSGLRHYGELDGRTFVICLGGMRCATSWLAHYLDTLPRVAVSPIKEVHFFNVKFGGLALSDMDEAALRRVSFLMGQKDKPVGPLVHTPYFQAAIDRVQMIYDDNAYFGHFARLAGPEADILCDITPAYSVLGRTGFEYLRDFCASQEIRLKLVLILRDPVERFWSQLCHMQQTNPKGRFAERWEEALRSPRLCARADYHGTVEDLDAIFQAGDVQILFYERLFDPETLAALCRFIGADYRPADTATRQNDTADKPPLPDDARRAFAKAFASQYAFCRARFGAAVPERWGG